jgi:N-acetylglutamate synthase-like GNAT family acetyltransferase
MLKKFSKVTIRKATDSDREAVYRILRELDLEYASLSFDHFWVAEQDGLVAAVARLEEFKEFCFLSAVGTAAVEQGRGIASQLLQKMLESCDRNVYLYTVIPDFFKKFGFEPSPVCSGLPVREGFNCKECHPENCACMHRKPGVVI